MSALRSDDAGFSFFDKSPAPPFSTAYSLSALPSSNHIPDEQSITSTRTFWRLTDPQRSSSRVERGRHEQRDLLESAVRSAPSRKPSAHFPCLWYACCLLSSVRLSDSRQNTTPLKPCLAASEKPVTMTSLTIACPLHRLLPLQYPPACSLHNLDRSREPAQP